MEVLSADIFHAMQISLEFLDKGMKGLLTGDLSSYALKVIEVTIEKNMAKMDSIAKEIEVALHQ